MFENIKMIITDVDGVLTDGGMYYDHDGLAYKKFHTRDASAIHRLRNAGILICAVTSANDLITRKRISDMIFDDSIFNCQDKVKAVKKLAHVFNVPLEQIAYIGDDYIDLEAMKIVGLSIGPVDALFSIRSGTKIILFAKGGEGTLAEVADRILMER